MAIRFFDMFAGIGGFRSGLKAVGGFECIGHCEVDKYANQAYNAIYEPKGELYFEDARKINPKDLPHIDLICAGFPCQSFSIAGLRKGFEDDARGTLFFEIARIAAVKRPSFLLLENVPGLLSHDKGRTFATILHTLDELGYDVAWQVLNSKNFGVPQSRNLFRCMKERTMAVIRELGFCHLNSREDFIAVRRFFENEQFDDKYLTEELKLTELTFPPPEAKELTKMRKRIAVDYDVRRAAMFLKFLRFSYSSSGKSYASQPFDIRKLFGLISQLQGRMANVVVENQDFETLIKHYDRPDAFFYADPPYFSTEDMYEVGFGWDDHVRLRDTLKNIKGKFLLSYNDCPEIRELYNGFSLFDFSRIHSMAQRYEAGKEFKELLIGNYDLYEREKKKPEQLNLFRENYDYEKILKECIIQCKIQK